MLKCFTHTVWFNDIEITEIVSGGAKGVDSLAERYANEHNIKFSLFPVKWEKYGKGAGFKRNNETMK